MSIAMERFGLNALAETDLSGGSPAPRLPYRLQCHYCSFEAADAIAAPPRCPKCAGASWDRFVMPRSLLMRADQLRGRCTASGIAR